MLADSGTGTQPRRQASPDRDAGRGQASAGGASAKPVPNASLGLRIRGARDQARRRKGTTGRGGSPGSSRKVRVAWLAGRYRRGAVSRLAGASQAVYDPGSKKAPCRSLTADKFEASHCLLQSLVSVSYDHVRMVTGMRSTHLSRCPHRMPALEPRTSRPATWSPSSTSLSVTCLVPGSRVPTRSALERSLRSEPLEVSRSVSSDRVA